VAPSPSARRERQDFSALTDSVATWVPLDCTGSGHFGLAGWCVQWHSRLWSFSGGSVSPKAPWGSTLCWRHALGVFTELEGAGALDGGAFCLAAAGSGRSRYGVLPSSIPEG
jgi:hypothetical protein